MSNQWANEPLIDAETALHIIQQQFPALNAQNIRLLGMGWDNRAFLVNEELIFRFPRREVAAELIEREVTLLPQIQPLLPLTIPAPAWVGTATKEFVWPFAGYHMLAGQTADRAHLSDTERENVTEPLARFLRDLHHIDVKSLQGAPQTDTFDKMDIPLLRAAIIIQTNDAEAKGFAKHKEVFLALAHAAAGLTLENKKALVHGDLYSRHLVVDEQRNLTGVIDWGDIFVAEPAIDLSIAHSFLPPQSHKKFRDIYGPITDIQWTFARLRAVYHSLVLVNYGASINDHVHVREGLLALDYIARAILNI